MGQNRETLMCPVCKSGVSLDTIIPVYIRDGKATPV